MEKFAVFSLIVTAAAMASVMWPEPKVTEIEANFLTRGDRNKGLNVLVTICLTIGQWRLVKIIVGGLNRRGVWGFPPRKF